jgi:hypothetical protein
MMVTNDVFNRIREVNAPENVTTHSRVNLHFCKLGFGKLAWLVQNVFGHRQLANIMKQRSGEKSLQLLTANIEKSPHLRGVNLCPANVPVSGLVLCVDRNCQRLNCVHVNLRHLLDVLALSGLSASHFVQSLLIESIQEMHETCDQHAKKNEG